MGEWREYRLGDVTDFLSGGTPSKSRADYWNGSIPWVSAKDMKQFRLKDTEDHITEIGAANGTRLASVGSVLLLVRGMTLLNDLPICVISKPMTFNQDVKALRPKAHVTDDYLPYLLLGNKDRLLSRVDLAGHGTGRLNSEELKSLEIGLPPKAEQRAIAHILGTLDDKIELNRRRNQTLEAMARALFKDWFVDFGPVRAKMEGRDPYLPEDLWSLFPDRLDAVGKPEGWEIKRVVDFLSLAYGKSLPAKQRNPGKVPVYGSGGVTGFHDVALVNEPTIIVGRKGTVGSLYWEDSGCYPIDTVFYVQSVAPLPFCYHLLDSLPLRDMNTDAAVPGLNRENVYRLETTAPPSSLVESFTEIVREHRGRMSLLHREIASIRQLRDTLMPKLISGELRIKDAERVVEQIA